ncbi:MAG: pyruvate dehydrogenase (acetyl-transferring) E1 component subunit alpha [Betaproteobacteria bacterium RIFCSPLOWO2_12_FULL_62_58]|nr:MAG: pyruvate dehydrogenase (acetyl-transferring) E1 component subunit alpha [Betaproteobacteria bacterium RIFCSPLOWO2_12_FULL_62_58]
MSVVAQFEIHYSQFLDEHGEVVEPLPEFAREPQNLIPLYRWMVLMRAYDAKTIALQRTGQIGTYASMLGKEAIEAGVGSAMAKNDVFLMTYRENGVQMMRGVTMKELFIYWGGDERGSDFAVPRGDFPICITIAAHVTHAVGVAYAMKLRREPRVAVCALGDGATSKGDFHEGLNAAGIWQLPAVFVVTNNQWAISVPRRIQTATQTLAQKAIAAGIEGVQIDGNDVIAVRHAMDQALAKARAGGGPTLIEAVTYRLSDHTTADDATRYRSADEVAAAWKLEPVLRLRTYIMGCGAWDKAMEEQLLRECNERVQAAVQAYVDTPPPSPEQMFDHLYATLPAALAKQRAAALESSDD